MIRKFATAYVAALALSFVAGAALPAFAQEFSPGDLIKYPAVPLVYFDLGIDVTQLPQDTAGAKNYYAAQSPETQSVLLAACENIAKHPTDAEMPQTLVFCRAITS